MITPGATDRVRLALVAEANQIAACQRRAWGADLDPRIAELVLATSLTDSTHAWAAAIQRPPLAQFRVLVALDPAGKVRGFAAIGPSPDPDTSDQTDALVAEFVIDPDSRGVGHGSRLLHATVETLQADGFTRATCWLPSTADGLRKFLESSGWAADGAHREIGTDNGESIREVRLHTAIDR